MTVHAINSSSVPSTLTKTISTGNISPGSSIPITFNSTLDMDLTGTYSFSGFTTLAGDTNLLNDSLATINVLVNSSQIASVSPAGPLMLCSGTLTLTASPGMLIPVEWSKYFIDNSFRYGPLFSHSKLLRRMYFDEYSCSSIFRCIIPGWNIIHGKHGFSWCNCFHTQS
ncbi:MAG: hypothetical protein IPF81_18180 [Bacteroidetes bacterium]|nr:hypothetical protein [Bacteroidota bacterium]